MTTVSATLFAVATELAEMARNSMPEMRDGEELCREWYNGGIYYRETIYKSQTFISQYDFRQHTCRQTAVERGDRQSLT